MTDQTILGSLTRPDDKERILVVRRGDGLFTFRKQFRDSAGRWGAAGPDLGLYDSLDTALEEAKARVWWLASVGLEGGGPAA